MNENDLLHFEALLLKERRKIFNRLNELESDRNDLSDRDIEREEEAQKLALGSMLDKLKEREWQEFNNIELALTKMVGGTYGICDECREPISLARLEVLPTASFCQKCAKEIENKQKIPLFRHKDLDPSHRQ